MSVQSAPVQTEGIQLRSSPGIAPLEAILCTERLTQRPKRAPDYETENRALAALVQALADSPRTVLQKLAETLLTVFKADSAGLSLLSKDGKSFYWPAIAGAWRPHLGGGTPRDFGPCGDVLDRNTPLLFSHWELRYPYLSQATPLAEEGLLVPFYVRGKAVGTIWAIAHDDRRKFDAEDLRQLESFGRFAAAAYQAVELYQVEESHRATKVLMQQQARALADVSASEDHIRELFNALPAAIYTTDTEGRLTFFNRAAEELAGRKPQLGIDKWCVTWRLYRPDGTFLPHDECPMATALKEQRPIRGAEAIAERPDGTRVPFMPFPTPLYDDAGQFIGGINMLVDISQRKAAEAKEKLLVRELQHRSNNLLAVIQTIAQRSLTGADSLSHAKARFEARLHALARAHRRITDSDWSGVELAGIVLAELEPFAARTRIDGPKITLGPSRAQDFSLAVHELVTNAVKYGALSGAGGEVSVSWQVAANGQGKVLQFRWRERGGPTVVAPSREGFGTLLLKSVLGNARLDYAAEGFGCEVDLPLSGLQDASPVPPSPGPQSRDAAL
jgi:PAS domain S-box-containing protein